MFAILTPMKSQTSDEKLIKRCHPAFRVIIPYSVLPLALLISSYWLGWNHWLSWIVAALAGLWMLAMLFRVACSMLNETYIFTNKRVIKKVGFLSTMTTEVRVSDIRAVFVKKSILGRLLKYANVSIGTAAIGEVEIHMRNVANADTITQTLELLRSGNL